MNNKQLAEMIKIIRKNKLAEVVGKSEPFKPEHPTEKSKEDPASPNQYVHKEEKLDEVIGPTHTGSLQKKTGVINKTPKGRKKFQRGNQFRSMETYTAEENKNKKEIGLGSTDTNQSGETISINPKDTTFSAKNTTIKERKEK